MERQDIKGKKTKNYILERYYNVVAASLITSNKTGKEEGGTLERFVPFLSLVPPLPRTARLPVSNVLHNRMKHK
jgi:hypothetical protein